MSRRIVVKLILETCALRPLRDKKIDVEIFQSSDTTLKIHTHVTTNRMCCNNAHDLRLHYVTRIVANVEPITDQLF
ncbi:uncharacterized protein PHALS_15084 [Plasmopara halstedii]|uniref:Uncharacterized protein n=1 Tax=Plasmopara halstedii TaxID=4781 RepID=A0A0P1B312_PLAHL|nr:uncharacterized protein PHALS_15084 [Plasmopara halstedii]CEG47880.1 hypothetical protein PHALS_15084 [Plasmopara halstedii]|eukprot:XP_024584249.1 hypothetical protein PHALS_15084 [Plasmopara halstedii]